MSSLTHIDKRYFEELLNMGGGYVLDFKDASFAEFFKRHKIIIHNRKYQTYGTSKAKKMRSFWEQEPDNLVGQVLSEMLDYYQTSCELSGHLVDQPSLDKCRAITHRLIGKPTKASEPVTEDEFLEREFSVPNITKLPVEAAVVPIIEARLSEARVALKSKANLSVIFLCGSVLEAILLGAAQKRPEQFNKSKASPKNQAGSAKPFQEWTLAQFIDVACDIGLVKPDVRKFGHGLRDFRNYIHPYEQLVSEFNPDQHTAKMCMQALKAALADVSGER